MNIKLSWLLAPLLLLDLAVAQTPEIVAIDWRTKLSFPSAHGVSFGGFMAVDSNDNVYACATPYGGYQVAKVGPAGNLQWTRSIGGVHAPRTFHLAIDSQQNVITTGYDEGAGSFKTVKFDPDGNVLWNVDARYGLKDEAFRIGVDAADNVYVTGRSRSPTTFVYEFQTIKYDPDGNELWVRRANLGQPVAIGVAPSGLVAVTGDAGNAWGTVLYDTDGNEIWSGFYLPAISGPQDLAISDAGDVYVCGRGGASKSGAVVHFDPTGAIAWVGEHTGPYGGWDYFRRLALDDAGDVVAVGQAFGVGYLDWSVVKFDSSGNEAWSAHYSGFDANDEWATGVRVDSSGAAYVTGFSGPGLCGPLVGVDTTVVKYAPDGTQTWAYRIPCAGSSGAIDLDSRGGVVVSAGSWEVLRLEQGLAASTYCTAKTNSCGSLPAIGISGVPSASSSSGFTVSLQNAKARKYGMMLYTDASPAIPAIAFQGGLLCLKVTPSLSRTVMVQDTLGTPGQCDGVLSIDMNAFAAGALGGNPLSSLSQVGTMVSCQFWARDSVANGSLLSDAILYSVFP